MHPLVPAVLLGMAGFDALELDAEAEPSDGEFTQPVGDHVPERERAHRYRSGSPWGSPNSLNVRSKTVKANCSCVVP